MKLNEAKLYDLIDDVFDTKNDSTQIGFSEADIEKMMALHPATLQEAANEDGPYAWVAVIPTSSVLMHQFLSGAIDERQLFEQTSPSAANDVAYLCSAIVLPEFRRSGVALRLTVQAIDSMKRDLPIRYALVWPFSEQGELLAKKAADCCGIQVMTRPRTLESSE